MLWFGVVYIFHVILSYQSNWITWPTMLGKYILYFNLWCIEGSLVKNDVNEREREDTEPTNEILN